MMTYLLFVTNVLLAHCCAGNGLTEEYYQQLISTARENIGNYESPQNNAEFVPGTDNEEHEDFGEYDFVIIGAGAAGSVLATRLSEIDTWNILLLEAGGEENDLNQIPLLFWYLLLSDMNWGYYSTPQTTSCLGMKAKKCSLARGKAIGGSTAINALLYVRGNPEDYNKWAKMGNPGWSYQEVLPYFIKSENSQIDGDFGYHGKGGFWNVEYGAQSESSIQNFFEANAELNVPYLDYNGREQFGISKTQLLTKHGRRQSTGTAFLTNARKRKNLKVVTGALVTKINIDPKSKTADSVTFVTNNKKFIATATKEILVSAGAINSPQLLMLSGIGPKKHLEELKIDVLEDLPVGKNLIEHPLFFLTIRTNSTAPVLNVEQAISQYLKGDGPFTNTIDAISFLHTDSEQNNVPMIEYLSLPAANTDFEVLGMVVNYNDTINKILSGTNPATDFLTAPLLLHPKSRGTVTLKSNSPIDFPNIDLNMLSEPDDVENIIKGIEHVLKLLETEAFRKINATLLEAPICTNFEKLSKNFWECLIRILTINIYHPVGTTAMGPNKATSVVDTNLKVHGIDKLRVVDAGIFPSSVSGHPAAPTVMVAEKISDVIKREYTKGNCATLTTVFFSLYICVSYLNL